MPKARVLYPDAIVSRAAGLHHSDERTFDATPDARARVQTMAGYSCLLLSSAAAGTVFSGALANGHDIIPILLTVSVGFLAVAIWDVTAKDYGRAWAFGGFAGFNFTWALLQLGIWHNWFGIPQSDVPTLMTVYMAIWIALFTTAAIALASTSLPLTAVLLAAVAGLGLDIASYHSARALTYVHLAAIPIFAISAISLAMMLTSAFRSTSTGRIE
jgi:hypothetical protein